MKKIFLMLLLILLPMKINAFNLGKSAILMEEDTKRILVSKDINSKRLIASTTKIMTAVIAIESKKMDNIVTVGNEVLEAYGSSVYLKIGQKIKLEDLVYGLLLRSGNDAALAIQKYLGDEKFIIKMNEKAKKIGMKNTIFNNPHGLDEKTSNYSTAYDMALLMRYANSLEMFKKISGTKKYKVKIDDVLHIWNNKNKLLKTYEYATGGKTGFTEKAGRTLVTSASKNGMNLIVVTLNDGNDFKNHKELYEYGFNNYRMIKVFDKNNIKIKNVYANDDFFYPLTEDEFNLIRIDYKILDKIKKDNSIGYANVYLGNNLIHKEKLFSKQKIKNKKNTPLIKKIMIFFN